MADSSNRVQLAVLGAGPGGYAAAFRAADLGLEVALIGEEARPGGVCLFRGCIPSKALLHVARQIADAREAASFGVLYGEPKIEVDRVRQFSKGVVEKLTAGLSQLSERRGIRYIQGRASLADSHTIRIETRNGESETLHADHSILATGSKPVRPRSLFIESERVLDSTGALELENVPPTLLVVGGGYIGLELGTVYAALGSRVTLVEMMDGLLPGVDRDLVRVLEKRLDTMFDSILLRTKVASMKETSDGIRATFEGEDVEAKERTFEKVLVAIGRTPRSDLPGLEKTGVEIGERGFIAVDRERRTADSAIFAIGDVAGEPMLAHKAALEGKVAAEVLAGEKAEYEPQAIPAVVFTDPEIAWCGLTESQAKQEGRNVEVARFPWEASGRALTLGRPQGLTKLLVDPATHRILGAGFVGSGAGELVAETVVAIEMAATATDVALSNHPHPTLSETVMEAAELYLGTPTHIYRRKKA
jgi:dihydrolipoamide dehydrogenase